MAIWSYCAFDWRMTTKRMGGVKPILTPPYDITTIDDELAKATSADIVYLNLHGFADQPHFYGQQGGAIGPTALTAANVKKHKWTGITVFASVCFSAGAYRPIASAFLDSGAEAFIGSTTEAYGRVKPVIFDGEADRLAYYFFKAHERGGSPTRSLSLAKRWLRFMSWPVDKDDEATLKSFIVLTRKKNGKEN